LTSARGRNSSTYAAIRSPAVWYMPGASLMLTVTKARPTTIPGMELVM
jgi:hypothetical protein